MKFGLLGSSLCLLGFFIITASLYFALQNQQQQRKQPKVYNARVGLPNITIFSALSLDSVDARWDFAVRSWLSLSPNVMVVLFAQHPSLVRFAGKFGSRVSIESGIDFS